MLKDALTKELFETVLFSLDLCYNFVALGGMKYE